MRWITAAVVALAFFTTAHARAQEAPENAAEVYGRALEALTMDHAENAGIFGGIRSLDPLSAEVRQWVKTNERAIAFADQAADLPTGEWPSGEGDAFGAIMFPPASQEIRQLGLLLLAAARDAAERGRTEDAVQHLANVFALAGHYGSQPNLMAELVEFGLIDTAVAAARPIIEQLDHEMLATLSNELATLQRGMSIHEAMRREGENLSAWFRKLSPEELAAPVPDWASQLDDPALRRGMLDPATREAWIDGLERAHADAADLLSHKDMQQRKRRVADWERSLFAGDYGYLAQTTLTVVSRINEIRDRTDVRLALLRAAIAYRLDGDAGLATIPDPASGEPFKVEQATDGFTLTSAMDNFGEPLQLTVPVGQ